ncbi:hypothetical protein ACWDG9_28720 [Streptomyces sp. NPDC001073]
MALRATPDQGRSSPFEASERAGGAGGQVRTPPPVPACRAGSRDALAPRLHTGPVQRLPAGGRDAATWWVTPSSLADKIRHEGRLRAEDAGGTRSRLGLELTYEAQVFGVGGLLEGFMEKWLREEWGRTVGFCGRQAPVSA